MSKLLSPSNDPVLWDSVSWNSSTVVYRNNMSGGTVAYNAYALSAVGGADEDAYYTTAIDPALLVNGENVLAVEIHQANGSSSDISFNLELTGETTCATCIDVTNLANTYVEVVNSAQLWNKPTPVNGEDIVVAVVDSGVNDHEDFIDPETGNSRLTVSVNFSTDTNAGDNNGHGTHVASIIAGNGTASHGARIGIAPKANGNQIICAYRLDPHGACSPLVFKLKKFSFLSHYPQPHAD